MLPSRRHDEAWNQGRNPHHPSWPITLNHATLYDLACFNLYCSENLMVSLVICSLNQINKTTVKY